MYKASPIKPLLQSIENDNEKLHISLNILSKFIDDQLKNNNKFRKEFYRINKNSTNYYQVIVKDINLIVNIKVSSMRFSFINDINGLKEQFIPIKLEKSSIISILTGKESFTTLYMKGAIQIKGGLSEAIKIRNALNLFFQLI